jgi:hypothetical protein
VPFACGGAFLIHRDVYAEIGGWDTSFFLDFEDVDLFVRAWQREWHCVTVPEAKVYHAVAGCQVAVDTVGQPLRNSPDRERGSRHPVLTRLWPTRKYCS